MLNVNENNRFFYLKKGFSYLIFLIFIDIFCFFFLFHLFYELGFYELGFIVDAIIFVISGPVSIIFVGYRSVLVSLPFILCPLLFLLFIQNKTVFKSFIRLFLVYWFVFGSVCFIAYITS